MSLMIVMQGKCLFQDISRPDIANNMQQSDQGS